MEGGLDLMRSVLGEHLKRVGRALITDPERTKDPVDFVHRLLHEKDKYDRRARPASCNATMRVCEPSTIRSILPACMPAYQRALCVTLVATRCWSITEAALLADNMLCR